MSQQLLADLSLDQLLFAPPPGLPTMDICKADRAIEDTRPLKTVLRS